MANIKTMTLCKVCGVPSQVRSHYDLIPLWKCNACGDHTDEKPEVFRYMRGAEITYTISADTVDCIVRRFYPVEKGCRKFDYIENGKCIPGDCEKIYVTARNYDQEGANYFRITGFGLVCPTMKS